MKLFYVVVMDDTEEYVEVVVANSKEEAEDKVSKMDCWSCPMFTKATEIDTVGGYKINLQKIKNDVLDTKGEQ